MELYIYSPHMPLCRRKGQLYPFLCKVSLIMVAVYASLSEELNMCLTMCRVCVAVDFQRRIHEGDVEGLALWTLLLLAV